MTRKKSFGWKKELLLYSIAGAVTTLVNFAVYFVFRNWLATTLSTTIAWIASVLVSYVMNAEMVFKSPEIRFAEHVTQLAKFVFSRTFSGVMEILGVYIFIDKLHFNELAVKIYIGIVVIVINYFFCKLIVFCNK